MLLACAVYSVQATLARAVYKRLTDKSCELSLTVLHHSSLFVYKCDH
jgi:hypothetical protein